MAVPFEQRNFQKELEKTIQTLHATGKVPQLLLHSCCAPCSSYVIEYLSQFFRITVFYYNPNISREEEYRKRVTEQKRFIQEFPALHPVDFIEGEYDADCFYKSISGLENCKEGEARCFQCYELRLRRTAMIAKLKGFDYFTTTLTISPLKNSVKLNQIGLQLEEELKISYLFSDFKKKEGYKRSIELSREYHLYRQNYCGCIYSQRDSQADAVQ